MKIILLLSLTLLLGNNIINDQKNNYYPLKIGSEWVYKTEGMGRYQLLNDTTKQEFYMRIVGDTILSGKKYFTIKNILNDFDKYEYKSYLRIDSSGNVREFKGSKENILFKFSSLNGESYHYNENYDVTVSRNINLETMVGNFTNCIKFHFSFHGYDGDVIYIFGPNIGLVLKSDSNRNIVIKNYQIIPQ